MQPGILQYSPIIIVSLPLIALFLMSFWKWLRVKTHDNVIWVVQGLLILSLVILAIIYYQGATKHADQVNIDSTVSDQSAYMRFIKEARRLDFNYTGDHNRMPLYPFLQALFYNPNMSEQELFEQGKQYNLVLSILLLVCLFIVLFWLFGFFRSYLFILIISFSLFIFKAVYVQAEILYYSLSALSFILLLMMLTRPTWLRSIATGIIVGLAYLTKGTILSSLPLFAVLYGVQLVLFGVQEKINHNKERLITFTQRTAYLLVVLVFFALVISPYAQALKLRFGHYFYNVNTTFYIWFDDWQMAIEEEAKHNFVNQWPSHLTDDELPNLRNYLREHSSQQIVDRFVSGFEGQFRNIFDKPFSVTNYWTSYLLILLMGILINLDNFRKFAKKNAIPLMFTILYFTGYLIAFAWYCPIACGRRFPFALYIPFLIAAFLAINELAKNQNRESGKVENQINLTRFFTASNVIVAITLIFNIWLVTNNVLFFDFFGS
jgi:MFS family permease